MILARSPFPTTFTTDLGGPGPTLFVVNAPRSPNPSPLSRLDRSRALSTNVGEIKIFGSR
jgi:hypothetical protein